MPQAILADDWLKAAFAVTESDKTKSEQSTKTLGLWLSGAQGERCAAYAGRAAKRFRDPKVSDKGDKVWRRGTLSPRRQPAVCLAAKQTPYEQQSLTAQEIDCPA